MEHQKTATMRHVQDSFSRWKAVSLEVASTDDLLLHQAGGDAATVAALQTRLKALRVEAERLLSLAQQALLAIKTPRSSSGDSTWG